MSFTFNWPRFSDQFHYDAIQMLNTALNKGNKPPIIADKIEVVELEMGTQPPELEIRDIGDLTVDQFRGIFRLTYAGDAHLVLKTKVQANPLNHKQPDIHLMGGSRGMLAAKHPLVVPMLLRLSHFKLSSYVVLVVSKQKGITLVFKTDPLQNVDINSTFDSIAVIQNFIQREIEGQLRQMFREDLPGIIHRLSQQWVKAKVEAPYLNKRPTSTSAYTPEFRRHVAPDSFPSRPIASDIGVHPHLSRKTSQASIGSRRPRAPPHPGHPSPAQAALNLLPPRSRKFRPDIRSPPEGLPTKSVFRGFSSLFTPNKGLADLAEESEESSETGDEYDYEDEEGGSFDFVDWGDDSGAPAGDHLPSASERGDSMEYETIPAVGGGTITRPRIFHSQSAIQTTPTPLLSQSMSALPTRSYSQSMLNMGMGMHLHPHAHTRSDAATPLNPYFPDYPAGPSSVSGRMQHVNPNAPFSGRAASSMSALSSMHTPRTAPPVMYTSGRRPRTPDSLESSRGSSSGPSRRTLSTDLTDHASYDGPSGFVSSESSGFAATAAAVATSSSATATYARRPSSERRMSITSTTTTTSTTNNDLSFLSTSPTLGQHAYVHNHNYDYDPDRDPAKIVLRASLNNSIHQLSTLSHSNHTLSPYTRDLSHFTVRSVPPRGVGVHAGGGAGAQAEKPVKARRKRTYRLGGKKAAPTPSSSTLPRGAEGDVDTFDELGSSRHNARPNGDPETTRLASSSPTPPSEFDVSDMDRYFPPSTVAAHDAAKTVKAPSRRQRPPSVLGINGTPPPATPSQNQNGLRHRPGLPRPPQ
ncbi:hypothetical protein BDZ97DRAFT_1915340 [Flammula alnicola]|nr:hypothetical protein BDZ97DRAFT_1915340 [Flammula alnicola]